MLASFFTWCSTKEQQPARDVANCGGLADRWCIRVCFPCCDRPKNQWFREDGGGLLSRDVGRVSTLALTGHCVMAGTWLPPNHTARRALSVQDPASRRTQPGPPHVTSARISLARTGSHGQTCLQGTLGNSLSPGGHRPIKTWRSWCCRKQERECAARRLHGSLSRSISLSLIFTF